MRLGCRTPRVDNLKLVNYKRLENAHKVRKKISLFIVRLLYVQLLGGKNRYGLVCMSRYDKSALTANDEARNHARMHSCATILAQKTKR